MKIDTPFLQRSSFIRFVPKAIYHHSWPTSKNKGRATGDTYPRFVEKFLKVGAARIQGRLDRAGGGPGAVNAYVKNGQPRDLGRGSGQFP